MSGEFEGTWVGSYGPWGYQLPPLATGQHLPLPIGAVLRLKLNGGNLVGKSTFATSDVSATLDLTGSFSEASNSALGIFEANAAFADNNGSNYDFYLVRIRKSLLAFHSVSGPLVTQGLLKLAGHHGDDAGPQIPQLSKLLEGTWVAAYGPMAHSNPLPTGQTIIAPIGVVACWALKPNGTVEGKARIANGTATLIELPVTGAYQTPSNSPLGAVEAEMNINIGPNAFKLFLAQEANGEFAFVQTNTPRPVIYGRMWRVVN